MTDFNYNNGIPNPPNKPSADVTLMQTNTNSISGWASEDHIGYATNNNLGGTHTQMRFGGFSSASIPAGTPASIAYPDAGLASNSTAQLYFDNSLSSVVLSAVRTFASIPGQVIAVNTTVDMTSVNYYNIVLGSGLTESTIFRNSLGQYIYTINLVSNCVVGTNASVFITTSSSPQTLTYSLASNVLTVNYAPSATFGPAPAFLNFAILQV